jgi:hypothetical protein
MANDANYERFKNIAAGIQSYILCIAVVVGGIWALFRYKEIDKEVFEQQTFQQAQVDINVTPKQEDLDTGEMYIAATVEIANNGKRNVLLRFEEPFCVQQVEVKEAFSECKPYPYLRVLRAGEKELAPFVVKVPRPGIYLVTFEVPLPDKELAEHNKITREAGLQPAEKGSVFWVGKAYLNVRKRLIR